MTMQLSRLTTLLFVPMALSSTAQAQGNSNNNGNAGSAQVYWHCEGALSASEVCVTYGNGPTVECRIFECTPAYDVDNYFIDVPGNAVDSATYTVWVGPSTDDLVIATATYSSDGFVGQPCEDLPLISSQGHNFCQDPREAGVKRNNTYYNTNATNGGNGQGVNNRPKEVDPGNPNDDDVRAEDEWIDVFDENP